MFNSLSALKSLKNSGRKVGQLKFKSEVNSILLKEYGSTYDINFEKQKIRLAGLKNKWLNVIGLQIKGIRRSNNKECT